MDTTSANRILDDFFRLLSTEGRGLLLLDYDGTLAPFRPNRFDATPADGVQPRLNTLLEEGRTRVVFVSGRPCRELASLAALDHPVEIWGCHGREYMDTAGHLQVVGVSAEMQSLLQHEHEHAAAILPADKAELKTGCLAFHWRGVPEDERDRLLSAIEPRWEAIAQEHGLKFLHFDGGIELAVPGRTKGDAVRELLDRHGNETRAIAFLGDDLTDEDGFEALGDRGLSVLVRNEPRQTLADVRITMPEGLLAFLDRWKSSFHKGVS